MSKRRAVAVLVWSASVLSPGLLYAQSTPLMELGSEVFKSILAARTPGGTGVVAHTPVFLSDPTVTNVTDLIEGIHQQVGSQVSLFPIGSSSGGFTYRYDSALGTFNRTTETFGPAFAERAETTGRGKFSLGMNYLHASYSSLDGKNLETGDVRFFLLHQPLSPPSFVEGDVIQAALDMKMTSDTAVWYGNYGITDRLDVGISVPLVHMSMDITYHATIKDFATHAVSPATHVFADGSKEADFSGSGSASGLGDILFHAKYGIPSNSNVHVAAALDVRVPSGDTENMLGGGATLTQFSVIMSSVGKKVSPHANLGYTLASGSGAVTNQINYIGGVEVAVSPRVTVVGDFVGRNLRDSLRLTDDSIVHEYKQGNDAHIETVTLDTVQLVPASLNTIWGTGGVKFSPWRNLLISASVLVALNDAGLRSRVTPAVGFEFAF
jgi:outer membrane putative beta-barrel porin/alpha-amylase